MIVTEDVGAGFCFPVLNLCKQFQESRGNGEDISPQVAKLVKWLSNQPKDKDSAGLARIAILLNESQMPDLPLDCLGETIRKKDIETSARILHATLQAGRNRSAWDQLSIIAETDGGDMKREVKILHSRASEGLFLTDELVLLASIVLRLVKDKEPRSFEWESEPDVDVKPLEPLPWFVFDRHTLVGKLAFSALKSDGVDTDRVGKLQWHWESAKVNEEIGTLYPKARAMAGFEGTEGEWAEARAKVKESTVWAMKKRGLPLPQDKKS